MNITMSCGGGTLRVFHLAAGMARRGVLKNIYVPYYSPKFPYLRRFLGRPDDGQVIPANIVHSNLAAAIGYRVIDKLRLDKIFGFENRFATWDFIDRCVAAQLRPGSDVVWAESVLALHTFKKAKQFGSKTILDRPNCHIRFQKNIVEEEYSRLGLKRYYNSLQAVEKSEEEYAQADYIAVLSSFVKRSFIAQGVPEKKLLLLPSGVNLDDFKPAPKEDDTFRIIYCGYICVKKGVHHLLDALERLNIPKSELWLIGKVEEDFRPILGKTKVVYKHFGYVPHLELSRYYGQGSVFVLPSIEEGLAKVTMEAMACGLPVIATPNTGAEDVMRDGVDGFIVPMRDPAALSEKILRLYEDPELRANMGRNGQAQVRRGLTFDDYTARVINACREL